MTIRELRAEDREAWLDMRERLWPDFSRDCMTREERELYAGCDQARVWVAESACSALVGFVEASIREGAEGCETRPVGYIEGWYVEPGFRRNGIGRRLIEAAEHWAADRGCQEMASDAEIENDVSRRAHESLGFREAARIVAFVRKLNL